MRSVLVALTAMGLAAVAAGPAAGQAEAPAGPVRTLPDWASPPDAGAVARHYPSRANRLEVEGRATIICTLKTTGQLSDCQAIEESPEGFGFGDAAVAMAGEFHMKPATIDGQPVETAAVRIPVSFRLPERSRSRWPWEKADTAPHAADQETGKQKPDPDPSILARPWMLIGLGLAILAGVGAVIALVSGAGRSRLPDL